MKPLIKWPGGKAGEIKKFEHLIPSFERYIEPFFGGGALYFHLAPQKAVINDISPCLMDYYRLIQKQDAMFKHLLLCYNDSFTRLCSVCDRKYGELGRLFTSLLEKNIEEPLLRRQISSFIWDNLSPAALGYDFFDLLVLDPQQFFSHLTTNAVDKMLRTVKNHETKPFNSQDLEDNLITGLASGYYMYFRRVFNDISLGNIESPSFAYKIANFYFIREYCYGSMFRYNAAGEFNIPYGGMSYNGKDMRSKIDHMFNPDMERLFKNTGIYCLDFEEFLQKVKPTKNDFIFLDPPYDTDFSEYEGNDFTLTDQTRLDQVLRSTPAKFLLVIKNTDFIYHLYKDHFHIDTFENMYTYNVRSRNKRAAEHLIVTNLPF